MKILVYGINYAPDLVGVAKYTTEMCQYLGRAGHEVKVVTTPPYYPSWKVAPPYKSYVYKRETADNIQITRCPLYVPKTQNALRRILHHLSFAIASAPVVVAAALRFRPDVVLAVAPSLLGVPAAITAARLSRASAWLHVQDFEIDAAFDLHFVSGTYFKRLALAIERRFFKSFDLVSTISPKMMASLESKGVPAARRFEFRNWVDTDEIRPLERNATLRASLDIPPDATIALYSGNMAVKHGIEYLAAAAERLAQLRPNLRLLFVRNRADEGSPVRYDEPPCEC